MNRLLAIPFMFYAIAASASSSVQNRWEFEVLLDDKKIGYHDFIVSEESGEQTVSMEAKFNVKLLFVNVFNYKHRNEEIWRDNCLASIDAQTVSNGKDFVVRGQAAADQFQLQTASTEKGLPQCVMTFAYWNPDFLKAERLLNSQTGDYEEVSIEEEGVEELLVDGKEIQAIRYSVTGAAAPITLWYAVADHRWLALESVVGGGRVLRYKPVSLPDAFAASATAGD